MRRNSRERKGGETERERGDRRERGFCNVPPKDEQNHDKITKKRNQVPDIKLNRNLTGKQNASSFHKRWWPTGMMLI